MKQLTIRNKNGKFVADSREVALMTGKQHKHLIRDIDQYIDILNKSTSPKLDPLNFFIESAYKDNKGEVRRCYDLTRKGCDMVANKLTGERGVLFTASYVSQFEEMENKIKAFPQTPGNYKEALLALVEQIEQNEILQTEKLLLEQKVSEYQPKITYLDRILSSKGTLNITQIAKDYDLTGPALNKILHEEGIQYKQNGQWLLYAKHMNKGYTNSETIDITRSNGDPDVRMHTKWTQKGRLFIHEILTKRGIIPFMDRKNISA